MRACQPRSDGYVERDGVKVFYEVFGDGEATVLLLPAWSIVHSRLWKAQVPYLARHFRVVAFDGRGSRVLSSWSPALGPGCTRPGRAQSTKCATPPKLR